MVMLRSLSALISKVMILRIRGGKAEPARSPALQIRIDAESCVTLASLAALLSAADPQSGSSHLVAAS
jgi:hypothetical protein